MSKVLERASRFVNEDVGSISRTHTSNGARLKVYVGRSAALDNPNQHDIYIYNGDL